MIPKSTFKVVMLGEGRVGKTSLTSKFCLGKFDDKEESSTNASYLEKELEVDGRTRTMALWDTAGQEKYAAMAPIHYRDADGAVLVYDITIKETFEKVHKWIAELRDYVGDDITIIIVGNKCDRENERQVNERESKEWAQKYGAVHFNTSAKSGKGIEEAFQYIAKQICKKKDAKMKKKNIVISEGGKKKKQQEQSSCC